MGPRAVALDSRFVTEALGEDVETEAPAASEVADAAAFEARRNDGEDWEEEAFGSIDGH